MNQTFLSHYFRKTTYLLLLGVFLSLCWKEEVYASGILRNIDVMTGGNVCFTSHTQAESVYKISSPIDLTGVTSISLKGSVTPSFRKHFKDIHGHADEFNNQVRFIVGISPDNGYNTNFVQSWDAGMLIGRAENNLLNFTPVFDVTTLSGQYYVKAVFTLHYFNTAGCGARFNLGESYFNITEASSVAYAPNIVAHPASVSVDEDTVAQFSCGAVNASSYQWFKNGIAIPGAVLSTYAVQAKYSDSGSIYHCRVTNGNGSEESLKAVLTVNIVRPVITKQPVNAITIEGRQVSFTCVAVSVKGINYQWQKYQGEKWQNIVGAVSEIFTVTPHRAEHDTLYRCIVTNNFGSAASNSARLSVADSSITDIGVQYPLKEIDYGKALKASDLYAVIKYNNGTAIVSQNLEGLKFDSMRISTPDGQDVQLSNLNAEKYLFSHLGDYIITTKYTASITNPDTNAAVQKTFTPSFKIACVDREAPEILEHKISWEDGSPVLGLTKEPGGKIMISVIASDNSTNDSDILYEWYKQKGGSKDIVEVFHKKNSTLTVSSDMGNGIFIVQTKDMQGNISREHKINVTVWDMSPPVITCEVASKDSWTRFKKVKIHASDDIALPKKAYFFHKQIQDTKIDSKQTSRIQEEQWSASNTYEVKENGVYTAFVRDGVGNIVSEAIHIQTIDTTAPVVNLYAQKGEDGKSADIIIEAHDTGGSGLYRVQERYACFQVQGESIEITDRGSNVEGRFNIKKNATYTVFTADNAGNADRSSITIDIQKILHGGNQEEFTYITAIRGENTDGTNYPDYTNASIRLYMEIDNSLHLPVDSYSWDYQGGGNEKWDGTGTWTNSSSVLVTKNGVYRASIKDLEGHVYGKNIEITSIDKTSPIITVSREGTELLIHASDEESGVAKIMIDGGSLDTIQELKYASFFKAVKEQVGISENGKYQLYAFDRAGNRSDMVTKDITLSEEVKEERALYTVTFHNYNGAILKSQKVREGTDANPPNEVFRKGYRFIGWNASYTNIQKNTAIKAMFEKEGGGEGNQDEFFVDESFNENSKENTSGNLNENSNGIIGKSQKDIMQEGIDVAPYKETKVEKCYIPLTEYTNEAQLLELIGEVEAAEDKIDKNKKSESLKNSGESNQNNAGTRNIRNSVTVWMIFTAIIVLLLCVVFYYLNKKYYWISLPF